MLDHLQQKLSRVQKLKRRFEAGTVEDLVRLREATAGEVVRLERLTDSLEELEGALAEARGAALDAARALHASRAKAAGKLERSIARTLVELEMGKAAFRIPLEMDEALLSGTGADRVEFLFSANRGEEPRPLQKIASGGELSRVLLAFKAVLADAYPVPTYVFDEIDAGIGGKTALAVGRLLAEMAREQQVLCITHTAQLAAFADHHLVVSKTEKGGRTRATVARLDSEDAVVGELARMLSGLADSATALSHARELRTHALAGRSGRV
jgi:DNA repair protein RecN (Recombination protein N)